MTNENFSLVTCIDNHLLKSELFSYHSLFTLQYHQSSQNGRHQEEDAGDENGEGCGDGQSRHLRGTG